MSTWNWRRLGDRLELPHDSTGLLEAAEAADAELEPVLELGVRWGVGVTSGGSSARGFRFVCQEFLRNVRDHAATPDASFTVERTDELVHVICHDRGIGVRASLARSWPSRSTGDALELALLPGVTGATRRLGGDGHNAGAGLFMVRGLVARLGGWFVLRSGDSITYLTPGATSPEEVQAAPTSAPGARQLELGGGVPLIEALSEGLRGTTVAASLPAARLDQAFMDVLTPVQEQYWRGLRALKSEGVQKFLRARREAHAN